MNGSHLGALAVGVLLGFVSFYFLGEQVYACKVDTFYGVPQCMKITDKEECNGDRNLLQVATPYDERTRVNENGDLVSEESKHLCVERKSYEIKKGIIFIEGFHWY